MEGLLDSWNKTEKKNHVKMQVALMPLLLKLTVTPSLTLLGTGLSHLKCYFVI